MSEAVRALAIDDDSEHRDAFERLGSYGVTCRAEPPPADLAHGLLQLLDDETEVVLLDFCLHLESADAQPVSYRGGAAAAVIRETRPDLPIILVTQAPFLKEHFDANPALRGLFDDEITKEDLNSSNRQGVAEQIQALVSAFQQVKEAIEAHPLQDEAWIGSVLRATEPEAIELVEMLPIGPRSVQQVTRWLKRSLVAYPGPLGDDLETCTRLGIALEALDNTDFEEWLEGAKYKGPFSSIESRWWSRRVDDLASRTSGEYEGLDEIQAIEAQIGCDLSRTECESCGRIATHGVCAVCREPVDASHSVDAVLDDRPNWTDSAVVCFQCIKTGRDEGKVLRYPPGTALVLRRVRTGET